MSAEKRTGAEALVGTLAECGVEVCFANPGTSEMNLVTALDHEPRIRSVLCLFEGVATGAADGYARVAGKPAMTLLHLGAGYMNGGANIHNARRGHVPMINVIGDHATYHLEYDAPLTSDIKAIVTPNSIWVESVNDAKTAGPLAAKAFAESLSGKKGPISLILPANAAWDEGGEIAEPLESPKAQNVSDEIVSKVADKIRAADKPVLLVQGSALLEAGLPILNRLSEAGIRIVADTFCTRHTRGVGMFAPDKMMYFAEMAIDDLIGHDLMILAGVQTPAAFFAYPGKPSLLVPEGCELANLGGAEIDSADVLSRLAGVLAAEDAAATPERKFPEKPIGVLTPNSVGESINRHMPAGSLVSDDGVTSSMPIYLATITAEYHDWMNLTGGAIGQGLPLAVGASLARPDAHTIALTGDGAGMYTVQALWTMARENLNVTSIVFVNHSYRILNIELERTGAGNPGPAAQSMLNLGSPEIDWVKLSEAQGVKAYNARTAEEFDDVFAACMNESGPKLIAVHL